MNMRKIIITNHRFPEEWVQQFLPGFEGGSDDNLVVRLSGLRIRVDNPDKTGYTPKTGEPGRGGSQAP